ncbi:hypothetical protein L7F22_041573 [Adiantum nelumboides]|nr:hypothetical protein [Adiantum nelumboides]
MERFDASQLSCVDADGISIFHQDTVAHVLPAGYQYVEVESADLPCVSTSHPISASNGGEVFEMFLADPHQQCRMSHESGKSHTSILSPTLQEPTHKCPVLDDDHGHTDAEENPGINNKDSHPRNENPATPLTADNL